MTESVSDGSSNDVEKFQDSFTGASFSSEKERDTNRPQESSYEGETLSKKETRAVRGLRMLVLLVLVLTAALVSLFVYKLSRDYQVEDFESGFQDDADRILDSFHESVERKLGAMDALSATITSYAKSSGSEFPNVTLPDFEVRAASTRALADGVFMLYQPLVTDENRKQWEAYAAESQGAHLLPAYMSEQQLKASQDYKYGYADANGDQRKLQLEGITQGFRKEIWGTGGNGEVEPEGSGPYTPLWQLSPVLPLINFLNVNNRDLLVFRGSYDEVLQTGQASFGPLSNLQDPDDEGGETVKLFNALLSSGQYRHNVETYVSDPIAILSYPVFDSFESDRQVVGIITTALYWTILFADLLPTSTRGMYAVLENNLGQAETYRIDGHNASYVGSGDLHDSEYDYLEQSQDVVDSVSARAGPETRSYTAIDLNAEYIRYRIRLFPSDEMKSQYVNTQPGVNAAVVACVFVFTTLSFFLYDWLVERRQSVVLDKAVKSSAVIHSLFPEEVHDRLFEASTRESALEFKGHQWRTSAMVNKDIENFVEGRTVKSQSRQRNGRPIADLYAACTVFFADLAGFTSWASRREPKDVFELLESIYGSFDAIATRRNVFKVETIGDCYVAVTGLPKPQPDHAVIMAKFARDCRKALRAVLEELKDSHLGTETGDLALRIGLNSGEVTAGILRGEKSRFQLFGDTVNTAARMETTGVTNKIHCSQATADHLIEAGKTGWLTTREGTVNVKGKGAMQTYFVEPATSQGTALSESGRHEDEEP